MYKNLRLALAVAAALIAGPAGADEGMWTFDNFPVVRMRAALGWAPDQAWLDRAMAGTARLPGCSASNVSAEGLVLTNHHCVIACVTALSTREANYIESGFMARARDEELRCANTSVQVLAGIADVTDAIAAATADAAPEAFARVRDAEIARLERACAQGPTRCEVVTLYEGGRYALYRYRRYDDVRLVFAPEHAMAAFGGDPDNFAFPRYCIDFAFLRLYENGRPARTPNHLSMRFTPLQEGEIVLTAGNPGRTSRLRTTAELAFEREVNLPWQIDSLAEARGRLLAYAMRGADQERFASSALQGVENSLKGLSGRRQALADAAGFARVAAREADLRTRVGRNRAAQREVGDAWGEIANAQTAYRDMFFRYQYLEARAGERSLLFAWARDIVRGAAERERPDAERLPRYTEARLGVVEQSLRAQRPVSAEFEALNLAFWLSKLREHMTADDPAVRRILGGESPEALANRLARSQLSDQSFRVQLWEGAAAAVSASDDPLVAFVRAWDGEARAAREQYVAQVERPIARAHERIARARFRAFGEAAYPDATFSPRLSYGRVEGGTESDGRAVPAFTQAGGLYQRAASDPAFALTRPWIEARARLDATTIFNVSTSNDIIGGNSGSPLLDREGRVVGAAFDGNIHSLGGEYFYDGALNRSVSVASTAIALALRDVYGMTNLLAELEGRR
ncbi:MAG: S46 family peptidase [Hyphomonadaceae bacterium]|nr:S46 family peptidase [Hyphomonadaceae bacterium]